MKQRGPKRPTYTCSTLQTMLLIMIFDIKVPLAEFFFLGQTSLGQAWPFFFDDWLGLAILASILFHRPNKHTFGSWDLDLDQVINFSTNGKPVCDFLCVNYSNLPPICRLRDMVNYWSNFCPQQEGANTLAGDALSSINIVASVLLLSSQPVFLLGVPWAA